MKKAFLMLLSFLVIANVAKSQFRYAAKLEVGYQNFLSRNYEVDPGPNWKGYRLGENLGSFDVSFVNGISFKDKLRLGFGVGLLTYEKRINGYMLFGDLEYVFGSRRIKPLLNLKVGRNYISNDYYGEKEPYDIFDIAIGAETKINNKFSGQLKFGLNLVGASYQFLPIRLGVRF